MGGVNKPVESARLRAENIGGISATEVSFSPGITVLAGRNATNRTSLLQAIMAALGSERASLKRDAETGRVELRMNGETYTRTLQRRNGRVTASGDPYLEDPELPELFAFLLESNEARQAVARGDDLQELIMRPVDTDAIQSKIEELMRQKDRADDRLEEAERLEDRLADLIEQRDEIQSKLEEKDDELREARDELETLDESVENSRAKRSQLDERMDELREAQSALEDIRFDIETERQRRSSLQEHRSDLEEEFEGYPEAPTERLEELDRRIERIRTEKTTLDANINSLQETIQFNRQMLDEDGISLIEDMADETDRGALDTFRREGNVDLLGALRGDYTTSGSVTDQLVDDQRVPCWTCGSTVEKSRIRTTIERLQDLQERQLTILDSLNEDLEELRSERERIRSLQQQSERKREELRRIEADLESCEAQIEQLREQRDEVTEKIETLEDQADELRDEEYAEIVDAHKRVNELEVSRSNLKGEYESIEEEIQEVEQQLTEPGQLRAQREELTDRLTDLRTRVRNIEARAVEEFNEHMHSVLDVLGYENLDRIWIERTERPDSKGTEREFVLHIVRSSEAGAAYEDTIDHLSESEREVTGLVFALAGYLVHDVHETVPFMLLDSLEAIDSERIADLVSYLEEYVPYLVVALLNEDAAELDDGYRYVEQI